MLFTINELFDLIIMTIAIGYIFSTFIKKPVNYSDPLEYYKNPWLENLKFGIIVAAPAVVLHEIAHKFVAISFGATATLHAPLFWYMLIILLTLVNFPIIFFVGGYVTHTPLAALPSTIVALAGPLTNLILWALFVSLIKFKLVKKEYYKAIIMSAKINLFLGIFNLIPLPGFDGYNALMSLISLF